MRQFAIIILLLSGWASSVNAQLPLVWEPDVSISGSLYGPWSWSTKFLVRAGLGQFGEKAGSQAGKLLLAESQGFVSRRLVGGRRLTMGFLYGVESPFEDNRSRTERRLIWQYGFRGKFGPYQLSHRLRVEQRFVGVQFQHRLRYRLVTERPLQGDKLDVGEWYFMAGSEFLLSSNASLEQLRFDNRTGVGVGLLFKNEHRLQFELQHRAQHLFDDDYQSRLWLLSSWIVPL